MSDKASEGGVTERAAGNRAHWLVWLFAVVGLCGVVAMIVIAAAISQIGRGRDREPAPIAAKDPGERFAIASVDQLPGTNLAQVVIATERSIGSAGGSSYSPRGGSLDERNLLLLDKATGISRKVLADNGRQIVARHMLPAVAGVWQHDDQLETMADAEGKARTLPVSYYLLRIRAPGGGPEDVLLGDLRTGRQGFILKGIDGVDRIWMQTPTRVAMLMRQGRKLQYRAFEIPELKLVALRPIEID